MADYAISQMDGKLGVVLVVDDEKGVLNLISAILKKEGHEIFTAESGYAGFTILDNRAKTLGDPQVDLVITDWKMQGWDGIKLLTEIRLRTPTKIPFILMSGAVTREELEIAARNKADGILLKPIAKEALLAKVAEMLKKKTQ